MKYFKNILLVMDGDLSNMLALKQAIMMAENNHAKLTLLSVVESLPKSARMLITAFTPNEIKNKIIRERLDQLDALTSLIRQDDVTLQTRVLYGDRSREIAREAAENGHDLVIDISGKGVKNNRLIRNCDCQVMFMKPEDYRTSDRFQAALSTQYSVKKVTGNTRIRTGTQSFAG